MKWHLEIFDKDYVWPRPMGEETAALVCTDVGPIESVDLQYFVDCYPYFELQASIAGDRQIEASHKHSYAAYIGALRTAIHKDTLKHQFIRDRIPVISEGSTVAEATIDEIIQRIPTGFVYDDGSVKAFIADPRLRCMAFTALVGGTKHGDALIRRFACAIPTHDEATKLLAKYKLDMPFRPFDFKTEHNVYEGFDVLMRDLGRMTPAEMLDRQLPWILESEINHKAYRLCQSQCGIVIRSNVGEYLIPTEYARTMHTNPGKVALLGEALDVDWHPRSDSFRSRFVCETHVNGSQYLEGVAQHYATIPPGRVLILRRDANNPHDPNSVMVLTGNDGREPDLDHPWDTDLVPIGYLPKSINEGIARRMDDENAMFFAKVLSVEKRHGNHSAQILVIER